MPISIGTVVKSQATSEHYSLFRAYIDSRHGDGGMADMTVLDFSAMVDDNFVDSRLVEYRIRSDGADDGRLVGAVLIDILGDGISMIYSFYDPDEARRSLGTFMILDNIARVKRLGLPYLYLGYWVRGSRKMDYKARFLPQERLTAEGWSLHRPRQGLDISRRLTLRREFGFCAVIAQRHVHGRSWLHSLQPSAGEIKAAFLVTALGGLLFTLDLPLLRLSMADQWTMVFTRGLFLFVAIAGTWARHAPARPARRTPFIAGWARAWRWRWPARRATCAYIGAVVHTDAANVVFIIALTPVIAAAMSHLLLRRKGPSLHLGGNGRRLPGRGAHRLGGPQDRQLGGGRAGLRLRLLFGHDLHHHPRHGQEGGDEPGGREPRLRPGGGRLLRRFARVAAAAGRLRRAGLGVAGAQRAHRHSAGHRLLARGPRVLPSADVSMFFMLETVLTPVWIWLLFGEVPGQRVLLGGAVVVIALLAHSWWRLRGFPARQHRRSRVKGTAKLS